MPSLITGDGENLVANKTLESLLIETFTPQTPTRTSDSQGGYTTAWVSGTAFSGRLSKLSAQERMANDKETSIVTHMIYCGTDVTVEPEDRIVLGTRTFEIVGVQRPSNLTTGDVDHLEISVSEVDGEL